MPDFVVTQDMVDYVKYQEKETRKRAGNALLALMVFIAGMSTICYLAGYFR